MLTAPVPLPSLDFETYSEAGYLWDGDRGRWRTAIKNETGIGAVGQWEYASHPSTRVICARWDLRDGAGIGLWRPGDPLPRPLLDYMAGGGRMSAHNAAFEAAIWAMVCVPRYGWPVVGLWQWRCNAAKARAWGLPGSLGPAAAVLGGGAQKDKRGEALIGLLSVPQNPTKSNRWRYPPADLAGGLYQEMAEYCAADVAAETGLADRLPELIPFEAEVWQVDQKVNARGVAVDWVSIEYCRAVAEAETARLDQAMATLTRGEVPSGRAAAKLLEWLKARGCSMSGVDADQVAARLLFQAPGKVREALEIRRDVALSSVSKIDRMTARMGSDNRLRGLFLYHGCATARWSGVGPQPQNLPADGPEVKRCGACGEFCGACYGSCSCGGDLAPAEWCAEAVDQALTDISRCDPEALRARWGCSPLQVVSGCLRGLFVAADGYDLIGADFSAIEAVVLAALAGEDWRLEVFRTHGKIYEYSASKILGIPIEDFDRHKAEQGSHHKARKVGKVAELASGYGGGLGAWRRFEQSTGADLGMDDDQLKAAVSAWRAASPAVTAFWYACEGAAIAAVQNPGSCYPVGAGGVISYAFRDGVLYCRLPSGRSIVYQGASVRPIKKFGRASFALFYHAWGSYTTGAKKSWIEYDTYGGALVENICQAVARDLQAAALVRLDRAGYPAVIHVHDEIVAEVRQGTGDQDEFRKIMGELPAWATGWPLRVGAAWRGYRFRK